MAGFEPAASCSQSRRANQAAPHPAGHPRLSCHARPPDRPARPRHPPGFYSEHHLSQLPAVACGCTRSGGPVRYSLAGQPPRGRSSMAEPQPSKLVMRVRFPSPAPASQKTFSKTLAIALRACGPAACHKRAIPGPDPSLADVARHLVAMDNYVARCAVVCDTFIHARDR